jgi:hypothetical protein
MTSKMPRLCKTFFVQIYLVNECLKFCQTNKKLNKKKLQKYYNFVYVAMALVEF